MANKKLLITGGNGLVGSRVVELLSPTYSIELLNRTLGTDIRDKQAVSDKIVNSDADLIIHLAAKADVDGSEQEKELGKDSDAWKINVEGTRNIVDACTTANKKIIYISTDFVFDGEHTPETGYTEEETPNPVNWYAQTKYEGEKIVHAATIPWTIVRIAYPYRAKFEKNDFVRVFKSLLEQRKQLTLITDHYVNATFIDDIAGALDILIEQEKNGIFHATGSQTLSPYEEGMLVAKTFELNASLIQKTTRAEFFKGRAIRPFNLKMNNDKIERLGITMKTFTEGLAEIKRQLR